MPLSKVFLDCLLSGHLSELCNFLKFDATLSPEIRKDTLSVYYRGGRLLSIQWNGKDYQTNFEPQYFKNELADVPAFSQWQKQAELLPKVLNSPEDVTLCVTAIPSLKSTMDLWFGKHRPLERESVQRLIRENNQDAAIVVRTNIPPKHSGWHSEQVTTPVYVTTNLSRRSRLRHDVRIEFAYAVGDWEVRGRDRLSHALIPRFEC